MSNDWEDDKYHTPYYPLLSDQYLTVNNGILECIPKSPLLNDGTYLYLELNDYDVSVQNGRLRIIKSDNGSKTNGSVAIAHYL